MLRNCLLLMLLLVGAPLSAKDILSYQQSGKRLAAARVKNWISGYNQGPLYAGTGTLTKKLKIDAAKFSASAMEKIKAAGGEPRQTPAA